MINFLHKQLQHPFIPDNAGDFRHRLWGTCRVDPSFWLQHHRVAVDAVDFWHYYLTHHHNIRCYRFNGQIKPGMAGRLSFWHQWFTGQKLTGKHAVNPQLYSPLEALHKLHDEPFYLETKPNIIALKEEYIQYAHDTIINTKECFDVHEHIFDLWCQYLIQINPQYKVVVFTPYDASTRTDIVNYHITNDHPVLTLKTVKLTQKVYYKY